MPQIHMFVVRAIKFQSREKVVTSNFEEEKKMKERSGEIGRERERERERGRGGE